MPLESPWPSYIFTRKKTFTHLWRGIQIPEFTVQFAKLQIYIRGFSFFFHANLYKSKGNPSKNLNRVVQGWPELADAYFVLDGNLTQHPVTPIWAVLLGNR
jgi:hypothetical protein